MVTDQIIDWNLSLKLAGNQPDLAIDILKWLKINLQKEFSEINHAYQTKKLSEILRLIHQLHGAISYAGTPKIKAQIKSLEAHIKKYGLAANDEQTEFYFGNLHKDILKFTDEATILLDKYNG